MKKLEMNQMELISGGACGIGCYWFGWAAGLASAPALGPASLLVGAATVAGCCQTTSKK